MSHPLFGFRASNWVSDFCLEWNGSKETIQKFLRTLSYFLRSFIIWIFLDRYLYWHTFVYFRTFIWITDSYLLLGPLNCNDVYEPGVVSLQKTFDANRSHHSEMASFPNYWLTSWNRKWFVKMLRIKLITVTVSHHNFDNFWQLSQFWRICI